MSGRGEQQVRRNLELRQAHLDKLDEVRQVDGAALAHVHELHGIGLVAAGNGVANGQVFAHQGQEAVKLLLISHHVFGRVRLPPALLQVLWRVHVTNLRECYQLSITN